MLFPHSLFNKVPIGNELIRLNEILIANMKFFNKIFNLLIFMSCPEMKYSIRIIIKYVIDITKVLSINVSGTLKGISIYQYCSTAFYNILPHMILKFETLQMVQSLLQISIIIAKNCRHGGDIHLRSSCCQRHQFQYLMNNSVWYSAPQVRS